MKDFEKEFDDIMGDLFEKTKSVTYVCFVMDHSGSMWDTKDLAKNSFNDQLKALKEESGEDMQTLVSVIDFSDKYNIVMRNKPIEEIEPLESYWITGNTALYDSISVGISVIREIMDKDPREDKAALMIIQTDGFENCSIEFRGSKGQEALKEMIKELEDTGKWTFTFLAEGIDKSVVADIAPMAACANTFSYDKTSSGYTLSVDSSLKGIKNYYSQRKQGITQTYNFHNSQETS